MIPLPSIYELQTMTRDELDILHRTLVEDLSTLDPESDDYNAIVELLDQIERFLSNAPISSHACFRAP
jgi:hypothetical protein